MDDKAKALSVVVKAINESYVPFHAMDTLTPPFFLGAPAWVYSGRNTAGKRRKEKGGGKVEEK